MIDIDHFKHLNDACGHQAGDECLKRVARTLSDALRRAGDLAARYGGEEFAIILPGTDEPGALTFAEELRARVAALTFDAAHAPDGRVTVSLGLSTAYPSDSNAFALLIDEADRALYMSKREGRNRVSFFRDFAADQA